jgi:hypothetical protein
MHIQMPLGQPFQSPFSNQRNSRLLIVKGQAMVILFTLKSAELSACGGLYLDSDMHLQLQ